MSSNRQNLASRSGNLVETHTTFQPRVFVFHFIFGAMLLTLAGGLAYQQLIKASSYHEVERVQNQRRIIVPGPRGNIYDRDGRLLVGNKPRFAVVLYLDELRSQFRREYIQIRKNYRAAGDRDVPTASQMEQIARATVVQHYLDRVNAIIGRHERLDATLLMRHFRRELLLPYILINDLTPVEYAKLIEQLPVNSPLQLYTSSERYYPYGSAAAHTLGYVSNNTEIDAEDFPGDDLTTFKVKGATGRDGLELQFDSVLQGEAGGAIYRVDPSGFRINPPLEQRLPVQGKNIVTSLDIDLQQTAEKALGDLTGAAVMMDVNTGEVLVLASKPDYDLNKFSPKISHEDVAQIEKDKAWVNRAISGVYAPGSTFKIITSIAGFRAGTLTPDSTYTTNGTYTVGNHVFHDASGEITGVIDYRTAIEHSVNTFFINYGLKTGVDAIVAEARRFHLDRKTGIELPHETSAMYVGSPRWKKERMGEPWFQGDTANLAFGQGMIAVTPLQMACVVASLARDETTTKPTILHEPNRPTQHTPAIGIPEDDYNALIEGMERVPLTGTARRWGRVDGLTIAAKTGTAQQNVVFPVTENGKTVYRNGTIELGWYVGFAPVDHPKVAWAVLVEGDVPDESFAGGFYATPIATAMLKRWLEKQRVAGKAPPAPDADKPADEAEAP